MKFLTRLKGPLVVAAVVVFAALVGAPSVAHAAAESETVIAVDGDSIITIETTLLAFLVGSIMPLFTALATKLRASSQVKAAVNLVLSLLGGVFAAFVASEGSLTVIEIATAAIATYLASGVSYHNLWKPLGTTQALQTSTADSGLGSNRP